MRCIKTYIRNPGGKNLIIFVLSLVLIMVIHRRGYYKTIMTKMGFQMRVAQIVAVHPKKVFNMAGTNSLSYKKDIFEREYDQLIMAIKDSLPQAQLFLCNIIPQHDGKLGKSERNYIIKERNIFIKKYAKSKHVPMIDLYTIYTNHRGKLCKMYSIDGVHLIPSAYRLWANAISTYIN